MVFRFERLRSLWASEIRFRGLGCSGLYVCIYIYIYILCVYIYIYIYLCIYIYVYIYIYIYIYIYMCVCVCACVCMYACTPSPMFAKGSVDGMGSSNCSCVGTYVCRIIMFLST